MWNRRTYWDCIHATRIPSATGWFRDHRWRINYCAAWYPRWPWFCLTIAKEKFIRVRALIWPFSNAAALPEEFAVRGIWYARWVGVNDVVLAASVSKKFAIRLIHTRWLGDEKRATSLLLATFCAKEFTIRWWIAILCYNLLFDKAAIGLASKLFKIFLSVLSSAGTNKNITNFKIYNMF